MLLNVISMVVMGVEREAIMVVNRITKYLQAEPMYDDLFDEPQPQQPAVNPSAFAGLPLTAMPMFGAQAAPAQNPAALNIYALALAQAQQRLSRRHAADLDFGDF